MSIGIEIYMNQLTSKNDAERYNAFQEMLKITDNGVSWFNQYKDDLVAMLQAENSYHRSIAAMLLANLAKNDEEHTEYKKILPVMMNLINDEKFITQRQYIQCIWKVALVDSGYKKMIVDHLSDEFHACISKKHYNLLRLDIICSLAKIMKEQNDEEINIRITQLIESEEDLKNKKKYKAELESCKKDDIR